MKMLSFLFCCMMVQLCSAQPSLLESQRGNTRVVNAIKTKDDTLRKQFEKAGLQWPPKQLYIRSFKYDSQLEIWARDDNQSAFRLFKTYKVCALSGSLGPKRMEGDYQVPEGFYYINIFNPRSTYHMSLGINYPNASDEMLSDSAQPGGDIYIHGSCVTVGCIPINDSQIEEVYLLASYARSSGEDFIPVHIFPIRYSNTRSQEQLNKVTKDDKDYKLFSENVKTVYDYFEQNRKLPIISVNKKGEYVIM